MPNDGSTETFRAPFLIGADGRIEGAWRKVKARGHAAFLREKLAELGISRCAAIVHVWQRSGYDNALPAHIPANADLGGDAAMGGGGRPHDEGFGPAQTGGVSREGEFPQEVFRRLHQGQSDEGAIPAEAAGGGDVCHLQLEMHPFAAAQP